MKSGDITGGTGVPELTWCYNHNSNEGTGLRGGNLVDIRTGSYSPWEARFYNYGRLCRVASTVRERVSLRWDYEASVRVAR